MTPRFDAAFRRVVAAGLCFPLLVTLTQAQQVERIEPVRPSAPVFLRPYEAPEVPPVRLTNSTRLQDLIRAGKLYLTAHDAIALALENNIDIEVSRYNPVMLAWRLERSQAGGALPGVPSGASQTLSVASGQGVLGSQAAAGVSSAGSNGTVQGTTNATVAQVGPVTQTLDPSIQEATTFSHRSIPQPNASQSLTPVLIQNQRIYTGSFQQGFITGGSVNVSYNNHYLNENALSDLLNPSVAPTLSVNVQHNLLRGFGRAVNERTINVAKLNLQTSDLTFRSQLINTVTSVLTNYYALSGDYEDIKAKQTALSAAQTFFGENKRREELGALTPLDVSQSENQVAASQQALTNSQIVLQQDEIKLKNLISRKGIADPLIAGVQIVPLDTITMPSGDDLPPVPDMIRQAIANRADLLTEKSNLRGQEISALGTKNGILPTVQAFAGTSNAGLAGTPRLVPNGRGGFQTSDPYFVGGIGTGLGDIFRRNFPSENVGAFGQLVIHNRQAQADYGIDQLTLRQQQLSNEKDLKQLQVDILNAVVSLRQARARYESAVQNRILQDQLLTAEQKKFSYGQSTSYSVVQQQRDATNARATEIGALVGYRTARISLDQSLGATLEVNQVSIAESRSGVIQAPAKLPDVLPNPSGR